MKERPILFSAPMVRALLDGSKSQTRRAIKPQPYIDDRGNVCVQNAKGAATMYGQHPDGSPQWDSFKRWRCPYGVPGGLLWVRENFRLEPAADSLKPSIYCAGLSFPVGIHYEADGPSPAGWPKLRPAIHLPRGACRISLRVIDVRVQRLNDISEADCVAEGCPAPDADWFPAGENMERSLSARCAYQALWEQINGPGSWDANPWVWAVTFERV